MLFKRAMFTHSFDKMLREEEQKIMRETTGRAALYKLEPRQFNTVDQPSHPVIHAIAVHEPSSNPLEGRDTEFLKQNSNFQKIHDYRLQEYINHIENLVSQKKEVYEEPPLAPEEDYRIKEEIAKEFDVIACNKNESYYRQIQNHYLIKDLKNSEVYAYCFSPKYDNLRDIEYTKADLVIDSCILSDFDVIMYDLQSTG